MKRAIAANNYITKVEKKLRLVKLPLKEKKMVHKTDKNIILIKEFYQGNQNKFFISFDGLNSLKICI